MKPYQILFFFLIVATISEGQSNNTVNCFTIEYSTVIECKDDPTPAEFKAVYDKTNYENQFGDSLRDVFDFAIASRYDGEGGEMDTAWVSRNDCSGGKYIPIAQKPISVSFKHYNEKHAIGIVRFFVYDEFHNLIGAFDTTLNEATHNVEFSKFPVTYFQDGLPAFYTLSIGVVGDELDKAVHDRFFLDSFDIGYETAMDMTNSGDLIEFFPNPASSSFQILTKKYNFLDVEVIDYSGKVRIFEVDTYGVVNISNLYEGVYTVVMKDNGLVFTRKLVVRR